jgi:valyl-tRNA synthetase
MSEIDKTTEATLESVYEPAEVEERWIKHWLADDLFTADPDSEKKPFSLVIPPPNITGTLHLGHALNNTLQDIIARYKRLRGFDVLWVPGIDHAGIATQNVIEKQLHAEGTDRHALGREKFLERVWKWRDESGDAIINQLKRLGASCDWTRQRFTMDEGLSEAVREVFVTLYDEGLIYRGDYIINWCPRCHTALSDIEVEAEETDGHLWHLIYKEKDGDKTVTVATTRPETMLGDAAVAVHPDDDRYKDLIGKTLMLPLVNREIPVIADHTVDMEFGTGAVKITPAHDFNDFEMSLRHTELEFDNIMDIDAKMENVKEPYLGLDRYEARKLVVKKLEALGALEKIEKYKIRLGKCYRCHTVVEPRLSKQWFMNVKPLSEVAIKAVKDGDTVFVPKSWDKTYFDWMNNIRNWCISRQIWWGHRIPAWHCSSCDEMTISKTVPTECGSCESKDITQDPDVLDTWFSSALWPFSTLNWPADSKDLEKYYPTSTLFTSFDIIFFWVARMMMMGLKFMDKVPFKEVYIHALIRDADGQKMSKSKGNVIDPLVIMDKFGTDALRFTLAAFAAQGRDIKLAEDRIEGYRNFCNKLWNLARFTLMNTDEKTEAKFTVTTEKLTPADKWIITRLQQCRETVIEGIEKYQFDAAAKALYSFVWHELCDWYVELIKTDLWGDNGEERKATAAGVLVSVLDDTLKLLHPIMPFITEEIYSYLPGNTQSIMGECKESADETFPPLQPSYPEVALQMESIMDVIRAIRNIKTEANVTPGTMVECICFAADAGVRESLKHGENYLRDLAKVEKLTIINTNEEMEKPKQAGFAVAGSIEGKEVEVFIPLKGLIDVAAETARLTKQLDKLIAEAAGIEKKLSNESFVKKAPPEVVKKEREKLANLTEKRDKIRDGIERLKEFE